MNMTSQPDYDEIVSMMTTTFPTAGVNYTTESMNGSSVMIDPLPPLAYFTICIAAALCSAITVFGNLLVILSFIVNRTMRNFSNYLILNLAISDIIIGFFSMNVETIYNVNGNKWILGEGMCLTWLTVDYVASNTSVMNLLAICIDRYMAISNPVKYRQRTKANVAVVVMISVWVVSFLVWGPAILLWRVISPRDRIRDYECYIPFVDNNPSITIITAIAAFYAPTTAMCFLYWRVIIKIKRRGSNVAKLVTHATEAMSTKYTPTSWRKGSWRKKKFAEKEMSSSDRESVAEKTYKSTAEAAPSNKRQSSFKDRSSVFNARQKLSEAYNNLQNKRKSSRSDNQSSNSLLKKDGSAESNMNDKKTLYATVDLSSNCESTRSSTEPHHSNVESKTLNNNLDENDKHLEAAGSMSSSEKLTKGFSTNENNSVDKTTDETHKETGQMATAVARLLTAQKDVLHNTCTVTRRLKREKRATRLLKGILICFIVLWLPYNLIVIISSVCPNCVVSTTVWNLGYWLCYLNSTVNPFCYGFCNDNFKRTFKALLTTKWWTTAGRRKLRSQVRATKSFKNVSGRKGKFDEKV